MRFGCRIAGLIFVAFCCSLFAPARLVADVIRVPDDYATIQGALDAALDGDEIVVGAGRYEEAIDFLGKAMNLHSELGRLVTTIDATGLDASVVSCASGEGQDTILEGFTITGGTGTDVNGELSGGGAKCGICDYAGTFRYDDVSGLFVTWYWIYVCAGD